MSNGLDKSSRSGRVTVVAVERQLWEKSMHNVYQLVESVLPPKCICTVTFPCSVSKCVSA